MATERPPRPSERPGPNGGRRRASLAPSAPRTFREGHVVETPEPTPFRVVRDRVFGLLEHIGQIARMTAGTLRAATKRPQEWGAIVDQIETVGLNSVGIVVVSSLFIGMVMAVQFAFGLRKFGGMEYTPRVIALSFARELAPTLTAVIVGGRIGAGMAAEMGSMNVTEQVDAVRALGADPLKKLVWPRLFASTFVMPLLCTIALVLGVGGAMFITALQFDISASFFFQSALKVVRMSDFLSGLIKAPVFGAIIALIACHLGLSTRGGTAGVGMSTTRTVVATSIAIFIADFLLTKVAILIWPD